MSHKIISEIFLLLLVLAYFVFLSALAWWALGRRLGLALKSVRLLSHEVSRRLVGVMTQLRRGALKLRSGDNNGYKAPFAGNKLTPKKVFRASGGDHGS